MKCNENGIVLPRVLVATPVSSRHEHLLDEWIDSLNKLNYPIEVLLIDTTPETDKYFKILQNIVVKGKSINVIRFPWDYSNHIVQHLAYAREKIREFFLEKDYEFLMNLDDDIFLPIWGIERLLSYNKDCVGFYVHIYLEPEQVPCIFKSGEIVMGKGLEFYSFAEIDAYKDFITRMEEDKLTESEKLLIPFLIKDKYFPQLFKPYAVNLGCLLVKKNVLEKVPFRTHDTFIFGEDLWWFNEANDKRFEFWCDCRTRCLHKNTEWESVMSKGPKGRPDFSIAIGPKYAEGIDIIKR
jgi:GT2 family glycosyltransferase